MRFHHVLLAMPPGAEDRARSFYRDVLHMTEISKPVTLAPLGGAWFRLGSIELHLGIDGSHRAAAKAHPGIEVDDLDELARRLTAARHPVQYDSLFPGRRRFYTRDPFGNRLEFLGPHEGGDTT